MIEFKAPQGSREWHEKRSGMVTGTTLKDAVGSPTVQDSLMYKLIAGRMCEAEIINLDHIPAIAHGKVMEPLAKKKASKHLKLDFEDVGMLLSSEFEFFGCSPDAVVRKKNKIKGGIEIKCPNSNTHIKYIVENKVPDEYKFQVYAPFLISNDVDWWYFMSFDDRNYERPEFYLKVERRQISQELNDTKVKLQDYLERVNKAYLELTF